MAEQLNSVDEFLRRLATKPVSDPIQPPRDILNMSANRLTSAEVHVPREERVRNGDNSDSDPDAVSTARVALQYSLELAAAKAHRLELKRQLEAAEQVIMQKSWCDKYGSLFNIFVFDAFAVMLSFKVASRTRIVPLLQQSSSPSWSSRLIQNLPQQSLRWKSSRPNARPSPRVTAQRPLNPSQLQYNPGKSNAAPTEESSRSTGEFNEAATPNANTTPTTQPGPNARPNKPISNPSRQTGEFNKQATPSANTTPTGQPGPNGAVPSHSGSTKLTGDFNPNASPSSNTTPSGQPGPSVSKQDPAQQTTENDFSTAQAATEPQKPTQPLPDLRFGIPSTFDQEFLKQATQANAAKDEADRDYNNITDDPAQTSYGASGGRGDGELPRSAYETSIDKRRNMFANYMYLAMAALGVTGALYFGRNWESQEEANRNPDAPSGWSPGLIYGRIQARLGGQVGYYTEPAFVKLLPDMDPAPPYTLVLSLEDLMIFSEWTREHGWRTGKRPGLDYFLRYLSQYYELVLWTAMPIAYADQVIQKLDPYHIIQWPLFREATRYEGGKHIKDLSYLNRPLDKVIIMDTSLDHVKNQPENAIILAPWKGAPNDKDLVSYVNFLEYIATMGITDVREAIKSFEGKHIPTEYARREALLREQFNKQFGTEKAKKPRVSAAGGLMSALGLKPQSQGLTMDGQHSVAEGIAEGKMLQDQIRERGRKQYEALEKEIRENGAKWLKEEAEMQKKMQAEQAVSAKAWTSGFLGGAQKPGEASPTA